MIFTLLQNMGGGGFIHHFLYRMVRCPTQTTVCVRNVGNAGLVARAKVGCRPLNLNNKTKTTQTIGVLNVKKTT